MSHPSSTWRARGTRLARRAAATTVDYAVVFSPLALVGALRSWRGGPAHPDARARLMVALALTAPVACGLAAAEAAGGSPGKRVFRLRVRSRSRHERAPLPYSTALLRTVLKTAVPWEIGHQAVWDLRGAPAARHRGAMLAACAYAAVAAQAAMICTESGRTYADLLAATVVDDTRGTARD
ncbi:RDD family protein [Actinomadura alba]|uniref:RDD family protein n=1 Tax=Actinomadura alba TaxID=406431 RepID=A0ABR7LT08_9ACTN|nr:RDD family protein [Actinomadura alba]MBC6467895.1 RDD family protein [Actinomadura alba]